MSNEIAEHSYDNIRQLAMLLPPQERIDLADELLHSVSDEELQQFDDDDFELSPEQISEIERRSESARNGTAVLIDTDVHLEQMRQMLKDYRSERDSTET